MPTGSGGLDVPDEPVGIVLARMRRARRLTGGQLAALVGMSQPKISRIERGKGLPDPEDVGTIARALGADEEAARSLMERAARSHDVMTDWRPASASMLGRQEVIADWEAAAGVMRGFDVALVPGLLQTGGYAKAVFRGFQRMAPLNADDLTETAVLTAVAARVTRQAVLADPAKRFHFVMTETVLRTQVCPPAEMLAQIDHLREVVAQRSNVTVAVLPDGAPVGIPPMHGFYLLDDRLTVVDVLNTALISRSRRDVDIYREVFETFAAHAVDIEPVLDRYQAAYIDQLSVPRQRNGLERLPEGTS